MRPRIIAFPEGGIAYNDSLYAEFAAQGAEVIKGEWAGRWLLSNLRGGDVVHIHWPSFLYSTQGTRVDIFKSFFRFLLLIAIVRIRASEFWWTAHNLLPHVRSSIPQIDTIARKIVIRCASSVFVHGNEANKILLAKFPAAQGKTVIIPHGNWIGHYPACKSRNSARYNLKLPSDAFVYLLFGQCKPYKNLVGLIEAFRSIATNDDILLIAGGFSDQSYLTKICKMASDDLRIRIDPGFIPDDMVSDYLMACNAMCMPYLEILTSGTTMLALSYGRPVLSVDLGFLRETVSSECGVLIKLEEPNSLAEGLRRIRALPWAESDILRAAEKYTFADAVNISLSRLEANSRPSSQ